MKKNEIELQINKIQNYIKNNKNNPNKNLGTYYARLGILYQASDVNWHNGGIYKPLALDNFNKALNYELNSKEKISILQRKGMLLKMMSKGIEAIQTHQLIFNINSATNYDKSEAYVHIADAQSMMGNVQQALESLQNALNLNPDNLEVFYPMVQACKEIKCKTTQEWAELVSLIEKTLHSKTKSKNQKKKKTSSINSKESQVDIYGDDYDENDDYDNDYDDDQSKEDSLSTSTYWALYEAGLKAGMRIILSINFYFYFLLSIK